MMPMTMAPPATPSLMGVAIPGRDNGMVPTASPSMMPSSMLPMLGSSRVFTALPIIFSTLSRASCLPTMVSRSPYLSLRLSVARSFTSPRVILLTLTPYVRRSCNLPSSLPLRAVLDSTTTRLSSCESMEFQSIISWFQSFASLSPKSSSSALSSSLDITTSRRSLS